jgi:hypothetical protein
MLCAGLTASQDPDITQGILAQRTSRTERYRHREIDAKSTLKHEPFPESIA